jgi:hypothetical protein
MKRTSSSKRSIAMQQWEYCYLVMSPGNPVNFVYCNATNQQNLRRELPATLAELGLAGWELVSIISSDILLSTPSSTQQPSFPYFFFKRPLLEKSSLPGTGSE